MRTVICFLLACFVSTGCFLSALGARYPLLLYAAGFGIWALLIFRWNRRAKRNALRRDGERVFQEYMRSQLRHHQK